MKLGTCKENTNDAMCSNTLTLLKPNEKHPLSKLTDLQVQEIRSLKGIGITQREIAEKYGISSSQVSRYWNYKTRL
jgi:DNA invertase Pin-like site-specific DNA recombinase